MQLIASKATDATQASTACGRLPRGPKTERVNVIVGSPARAPPTDASATVANSSVPSTTASSACQTLSPASSAITPTATKKRLAFIATQKYAVSRSVIVRSASGMWSKPCRSMPKTGFDPVTQITVPPFGDRTWPTK